MEDWFVRLLEGLWSAWNKSVQICAICGSLIYPWELSSVGTNLSVGANSSVGEELSLAALYAERAGDGGEDGDDEVDDGFDVFFFHTIWDDW